MIPLTIELLLVAQKEHRQRSTSVFTSYIPGITGDVYALAAMYRDPEVESTRGRGADQEGGEATSACEKEATGESRVFVVILSAFVIYDFV